MTSASGSSPNLQEEALRRINRTMDRFNRSIRTATGSFSNLGQSVLGLGVKFTVIGAALSAPILAFKSALSGADQQYQTLLSGAAGLVAGTKQSFSLGESYMRRWGDIVESTTANIGADFRGANILVSNTIDDVKNALGQGKELTMAQVGQLDDYAKTASLFSKLAEGTGTRPEMIAGGLTKFINGSITIKGLSQLDAFSETKVASRIQSNLQGMGVTEKTASTEQRIEAFMKAVEQSFPPEMIDKLKNRPTAVIARWQNFLFGMNKGLFSLNRRLRSFGKWDSIDIDSAATAAGYFLEKLGNFFSKISKALGIKGDPMEALAGGLVNLGNYLDTLGTDISNVITEVRSKGVGNYLKEKIVDLFTELPNTLKGFTQKVDISYIQSTIDNNIKKLLPSLNQLSSFLLLKFKGVLNLIPSLNIGKKISEALNNIMGMLILFFNSEGGVDFANTIGKTFAKLGNILLQTLNGIDLDRVSLLFLSAINFGLQALGSFLSSLDWSSLAQVAFKGLMIIALGVLIAPIITGILGLGATFGAIGYAALAIGAGLITLVLNSSKILSWIGEGLKSLGNIIVLGWNSLINFGRGILKSLINDTGPFLEKIIEEFCRKPIRNLFSWMGFQFGKTKTEWVSNMKGFKDRLSLLKDALFSTIDNIINFVNNNILSKIPGVNIKIPSINSSVGNAANGNLLSAIDKEISMAPYGAKPLIANSTEVIIPQNKLNNYSTANKQPHIILNYSPNITGSDIDERQLFRMFKSWMNQTFEEVMSAEYSV